MHRATDFDFERSLGMPETLPIQYAHWEPPVLKIRRPNLVPIGKKREKITKFRHSAIPAATAPPIFIRGGRVMSIHKAAIKAVHSRPHGLDSALSFPHSDTGYWRTSIYPILTISKKKKFHSNVCQNLKFDSIWNPRIAQSKLSWYLSKMTASAKFGVLICSKSCFEISVYYCPIDLTWDAPDATFLPPVYDRRKTAVKSTILIRVSLSSQVLRNISWEFQPNRPAGWLFFLIPTFIRMLKTKIKPDVKAHSAEMSTLLVQQFPPDKQVF